MPLSRLENFLINTDGNILYVNPSDLDATDSFDNKGNSLTRPFRTIQRALIEAARFAYQSGANNDRFDKTTILLYPGTHLIDNRPGYYIKNNGGSAQYLDVNGNNVPSPDIELSSSTIFDLNNSSNVLYKLNSVDGGVVVPKGTSIVGLDLRKTKVRPLYVPDPSNPSIDRSALFRVTGGCYFWQFTMFDADREVFYNKNFSQKANPNFSHHKLTCFEYADGINAKDLTGLTDLDMYYFKLMNAYGDDTGNREILDYPNVSDFEPNSPEFKIVGDLSANDFNIISLSSSGTVATVETEIVHNLNVDDSFRITGVGSDLYNGSYKVAGVTSTTSFNYVLLDTPIDSIITIGGNERVVIEADNVTGASPYIFNCSLRSTYGMCGLHADGAKATGFKSMVVAQFTGIGLQKDTNAFVIYNDTTGLYDTNETAPTGTLKPLYINQDAVYKTDYESFHIKASNDAVIQAVSVFAIGFSNHFLSEDGADQSITNSNSNFGAKSLISKGFRKQSFDRDDTGYITHIVPPKDLQESDFNVLWRVLDPTTTLSVGNTSRIYLLGETDQDNPPSNITNGFRVGSKDNEILYIDLNLGGLNVTYSSPILMQVPSGDGPSAKKSYTVTRVAGLNSIDTANDILNLDSDHGLYTGETIRIYSDDATVPGGLENGQLYYAITGGSLSSNQIKLAKSLNNANNGAAVDIKNTSGGIITIISRVTDKLPGEFGHPVQYDSNQNNWYILAGSSTSTNKIYEGFVGFSTQISDNNSATYIRRTNESRDSNNRIYRLRYVVPKEFRNAKAPTENFVLQESKTVIEESSITSVNSNRNPRIIAGITTSGSTVTVTTEKPHKLSVNDRVHIKNVKSSTNINADEEAGFNGYYYVDSVEDTKVFTYTNANNGGSFIDNISDRGSLLPAFEKNEYDTTYTIKGVETVQEYVSEIQDGIYYLTCLIGNISPTVSEFSNLKFPQNINYLYPTIDKDNQVNDPEQSISASSNKLLGKVVIDDPLNSITKESTVSYIKDNRIGFAVTNATSNNTGITTIYSEFDHNLNSVLQVSIANEGSGYGSGIVTTLYNVPLSGGSGNNVTANITVSAAGTITDASIVDGGSAYTVGNTLTVPNGTSGQLSVSSINDSVGKVIQVVGIGTTQNRKTSGYNGLYKITDVPTSKSVTYNTGSYSGIHTTSDGIFYIVDNSLSITSIAGAASTTIAGIVTVTTSTSHGLQVGNKIKISGVSGSSADIYNSDFIVQERVNQFIFTIQPTIGITTTGVASAEVYKYGIGAFGEDTSLQSEKIGGNLISMNSGITTTMSSSIDTTSQNLYLANTTPIKQGVFLQIDDEILRVSSVVDQTQVNVYRGVLGTLSKPHDNYSLVRVINIIPSEVRRFSSIRASGHTFEYIGYGPGNYSTSLPQRIQRTLTLEEELLSVTKEEKGGIVFFSGMNDRGDFFTGERTTPRQTFLGEISSDATVSFDDVFIRNTLRVGGGPNRNLPSEFRGPVNFTNKLTSTDSIDGINAIKLQIKGNNLINPFFQVGPDTNPSLVVDQLSEFVGIKTASPNHELDVNGTIRATTYENFKFSDLPNNSTEESTFKADRVLKTNSQGTGYELVDVHTLDSYTLRSYGISNDPTIYTGTGANVNGKLQISGISTARFDVGQKVKLFGVTLTSDSDVVPDPVAGGVISRVGATSGPNYYRYWIAEYDYRTGKVGAAAQITPTTGVDTVPIESFNDIDHLSLTFSRSSTSNGVLVYRQETVGAGTANINDAKLVAILGDKELSNSTSILWKDYGVYEQPTWSTKGTKNEFDSDQIHFPNTASTQKRRGWDIDEIISIGVNSITVNNAYSLNGTYSATDQVKVVHDNTYALSQAIDDTVTAGGSYLNLPSGTFLATKVVIPTSFTLNGNGKNTILKQQYFALDSTDGGGNNLPFDGNFIGADVANPTDVTIRDMTIDGNSSNNITFETEENSFLVNMRGIRSSLFKSMEIRNSPADGLNIEDSSRISIENCSFVDGSLTDREAYQPLLAQNAQVLRINDSLFENYPGPVDLSATSVVSTGGNIIRNCGAGLRVYASGKITTTNNIILGPSDEYIPSPDIYDSDFNSINVTIDRSTDFLGPELLYLENGDVKDISSDSVAIISQGIGNIVGEGTTNETLGTPFLNFDIYTSETGRQNGYIQLYMPQSRTSQLGLSSALGYDIVAQEYLDKPIGYSTYIGIGTGVWNTIGSGATTYTVTLKDLDQAAGISTGDVVKLVNHSVSPSLASYELTVQTKTVVGFSSVELGLTGFNITSLNNGNESGYISIRRTFTIAKGRVGVI